jgi:hypothetical protein
MTDVTVSQVAKVVRLRLRAALERAEFTDSERSLPLRLPKDGEFLRARTRGPVHQAISLTRGRFNTSWAGGVSASFGLSALVVAKDATRGHGLVGQLSLGPSGVVLGTSPTRYEVGSLQDAERAAAEMERAFVDRLLPPLDAQTDAVAILDQLRALGAQPYALASAAWVLQKDDLAAHWLEQDVTTPRDALEATRRAWGLVAS